MDLKIIIEEHIPFIRGLLEPLARVTYLPAEAINAGAMRGADALITRTRTRCDASLLEGSRCRFIATATIGTDHIDTAWCASRGITVANAPGCNAPAVAQYVMAALLALRPDPRGLTLGIVGVGHVGTIVDKWARSLGMRTLLCDPPRALAEPAGGFIDLRHIMAEADAVTLHTPLTAGGPHPTRHLIDDSTLATARRRPVIINAARGAVTDTGALLRALDSGLISDCAIDCWEGEPAINADLLERAAIATPHIAGYSLEGKIRATAMAAGALCRHFGLTIPPMEVAMPGPVPQGVTPEAVRRSYDIMADTRALKGGMERFEHLRDTYSLRHEPC